MDSEDDDDIPFACTNNRDSVVKHVHIYPNEM